MTIHQAALLAGLFIVPTVALVIGHRLARRGARARNAFWGLVVGHTVAALAATAAVMMEPEFWGATDFWRGLVGYWGMLVLPLVGAAIGWLRAGSAPDDASEEPARR